MNLPLFSECYVVRSLIFFDFITLIGSNCVTELRHVIFFSILLSHTFGPCVLLSTLDSNTLDLYLELSDLVPHLSKIRSETKFMHFNL